MGSSDYEDNVIKDCFGVERLAEYRGKSRLDAVVVYGICPKVLEQAPGGREHAKMVPKMLFKDLSLEDEDGSFYLRADAILGIFIIDSLHPPPPISDRATLQDIMDEERREGAVGEALDAIDEELRSHSRRVAESLRRWLEWERLVHRQSRIDAPGGREHL